MVVILSQYKKLMELWNLRNKLMGQVGTGNFDPSEYMLEMRKARKEMNLTVKDIREYNCRKINALVKDLPEYLKEIPF